MNCRSRQTGQVFRLIECGIDHITIEGDPFYACRVPRADFERFYELVMPEGEGEVANLRRLGQHLERERDEARRDAAVAQAWMAEAHKLRAALLEQEAVMKRAKKLITDHLDCVKAPNLRDGEELNIRGRITDLAKQRDEALRKVGDLSAKLGYEEAFSRLQIQKRTEAEDVADQLRAAGTVLEERLRRMPQCGCGTRFCVDCTRASENNQAIAAWKEVTK